jgi:hypothetical protein
MNNKATSEEFQSTILKRTTHALVEVVHEAGVETSLSQLGRRVR